MMLELGFFLVLLIVFVIVYFIFNLTASIISLIVLMIIGLILYGLIMLYDKFKLKSLRRKYDREKENRGNKSSIETRPGDRKPQTRESPVEPKLGDTGAFGQSTPSEPVYLDETRPSLGENGESNRGNKPNRWAPI